MLFPKLLLTVALCVAGSSVRAQVGTLDYSFSGNGFALETINGSHDEAWDIAVRADGKIVVCGTDDTPLNNQMLLARFTSTGALDPSFSGDGKLVVPIGFIADDNRGEAVLIQPDNKILVAGTENTMSGHRMTVVRVQANGSLDASFGTNGRTTLDVPDFSTGAHCMVLLADGDIVLGGYASDQLGLPLMAKVDADGVLDEAFNAAANAALTGLALGGVHCLVALPDGRLLVGGESDAAALVACLQADGSLDSSFGTNGAATVPLTSYSVMKGLKVQGDGRIVGVGYRYNGDYDQAIAYRLEADGSMDVSFGENGLATFSTAEHDDRFNDVELLADGQLIAAGFICDVSVLDGDFTLRRLDANGVPLQGFGMDGLVVSSLTVDMDLAECMTMQPDGKLLVAGRSGNAIQQFSVARFHMDDGIGWQEQRTDTELGLRCAWGSAGLVVTTTLPVEDARFTVCDAQGAIVSDAAWNNGGRGARLLPRALSPGVYFGQVTAGANRGACMFVVPQE